MIIICKIVYILQRNKLNNYDKSDHSISQTNGKGWPFYYLFRGRELYQEDPELNGYVINLQKLDDILRIAEKKRHHPHRRNNNRRH